MQLCVTSIRPEAMKQGGQLLLGAAQEQKFTFFASASALLTHELKMTKVYRIEL